MVSIYLSVAEGRVKRTCRNIRILRIEIYQSQTMNIDYGEQQGNFRSRGERDLAVANTEMQLSRAVFHLCLKHYSKVRDCFECIQRSLEIRFTNVGDIWQRLTNTVPGNYKVGFFCGLSPILTNCFR